MESLPTELLLTIFEQFLPPLVNDITTTNDIPLKEQVELLKNLVACQLVCRMWRGIVENPTLRDPMLRDGLGDKGKHVKRLVLGRVSSIRSTFNSILADCPNVTYVSWACKVPSKFNKCLDHVSSPLQHLRRLDWKFSGNLEESVELFIELVRRSPVLECITIAETEDSQLNGSSDIDFHIPDSVTTLGFFCHEENATSALPLYAPKVIWRILRWIRDRWGGGRALNHVITSGPFPPFRFSTIELRPNPSSVTGPAGFALEDFVERCLPNNGSTKCTFIYSCTTYAPPERYDLIKSRSVQWVDKVALKTLGSRHRTEDEKWNAVQRHLDFLLKRFNKLTSVDLCDDFQEWKEDDVKGKVLEEFEKLAQERGVVVRYIKGDP